MASYEFKNPAGEAVTLDEVDKRIAEASEQKYEKDTFCLAYQWTVEIGMAVYMRTKAAELTPEKFDEYLKLKEAEGANNAEFIEFIRKYQPFLDGTIFKFHAWR